MRSDRLIINDYDIDLDSKSVIAVSSSINDLKDLKDHDSGLTNRFKVPRTNNNENVLGHSDQVGSSSVVPYRKNTAQYIKDGVNIVANGYAVVESVSDGFAITLYYGNVNFFDLLEPLKLTDIDLSGMDHVFDMSAVSGSIGNDYSIGYKYPLIDYGQLDNTTRTVDPSYLRLAVFIRTIFEAIISGVGFLLDASFISGAEFSRLMMTCDNDNKGTDYYDTLERITSGEWYGTPAPANPKDGLIYIKLGETWTYIVRAIFKITAWAPGVSIFDISAGSNFNVSEQFPDNSGSGYTTGGYSHVLGANTTGTFDINFTWTSFNGNIFLGDRYCTIDISCGMSCSVEIIGIEITGTKSGSSSPDFFIHSGGFSFPVLSSTFERYHPGYDMITSYGVTNVHIQNHLPNWTQKDFIKAIAQLYHLMFKTSPTENKIYIKQFSEIVASIKDAKDWSDKLHWQKGQHITEYRIGGYAQTNHMRFTHDSDDKLIPDEYGDGAILVDDETLQSEQDSVNLPFAASFNVKRCINLDVPSVKRIDDTDGKWTILNIPRLLIDTDDTIIYDSNGNLTYDDGVSSPVSSGFAPFCWFKIDTANSGAAITFKAGFDDSMLPDNYTDLTRVLNKTKKLTLLFRLSAVDIYQLDHFIPVYLKQFGAYFYINKVINWLG